WSTAKRQARMRAQNLARSYRLECAPPCRQVLLGRFVAVAFCAGLGPGVLSVFIAGAPGRGNRCFAATHSRPLCARPKWSIEAKEKTDHDDQDDDSRGLYSAAVL